MIEGRTGLYESETSDVIKWCRRFQDNLISAGGKDERYADEVKAMQTCIKALEKQTPKKPMFNESDEYSASCPNCGSEVPTHWLRGGIWYCERCGQATNWSKA